MLARQALYHLNYTPFKKVFLALVIFQIGFHSFARFNLGV
jgi:hypothetical protein